MYKNKRLEIVLILSFAAMFLFSICSINDKLSKKRMVNNLNGYVKSDINELLLKEKLTYNNKMYILYSGKEKTSEITGYAELGKNILGWWCANKEEHTNKDYLVAPVDSVLKNKALLICGRNPNDKAYKLIIETPSKTVEKSITENTAYIYIEEAYNDISKIKVLYK